MNPFFEFVFRIVDFLIPVTDRCFSEDERRNVRIVYCALLLALIFDITFGLLGLLQRERVLPWIVLGAGALVALTPLVHRRSGSIRVAAQEQRKFVDALKISADGLLSIVGDILDFSKLEAGKLKITPEPFCIRGLCKECLSVFAGITQSKDLQLTLAFAEDLPGRVVGDAVRIRQVLIIAVTAHAMEEDRNRCMAAGMDEYLTKPVKPESLREVMERWTPANPANA